MKKILFSILMFSFIQICKAAEIVVSTSINFTDLCSMGATCSPQGANLGGKILRFEAGGYIIGTGTIYNGGIDANYNQNIFDPNLTIQLRPVDEFFSACWFGAQAINNYESQNYISLQKAINTCITETTPLFIPPNGIYSYNQPLMIASIDNSTTPGVTIYNQVTFRMFGGSQFWSPNNLTTLSYTGTGSTYAIGIQTGKGVEISNIKLMGRYIPPVYSNDNSFYFITTANYIDGGGLCNDGYTGIIIDPFSTSATVYVPGGTTGVKIHDVCVSNFAADFSISPSPTQNSDILIFENIQVGDSKWGFVGGDPQSKGNVVRGLYSWGRMHTLISTNNGFWTFDGGNISGNCIRFANISASGWFATNIKDFFCENLGSFGRIINSGNGYIQPPLSVEGSSFDFVVTTPAQVILLTENWTQKFQSCRFRYIKPYPNANLTFNHLTGSPATFENCTFNYPTLSNTSLFLMN